MIFYLQIQKDFGPIFRDPSQAIASGNALPRSALQFCSGDKQLTGGLNFCSKDPQKLIGTFLIKENVTKLVKQLCLFSRAGKKL